jgi:hypothetical protein
MDVLWDCLLPIVLVLEAWPRTEDRLADTTTTTTEEEEEAEDATGTEEDAEGTEEVGEAGGSTLAATKTRDAARGR